MAVQFPPALSGPRISVIIPVYNVEAYLRRCLDSVISNTYRNLEIICVNDGSPDNCLSILREYEKQDDRIIVIDKKNGGVSSARNAGLDIATGEYISFIDSDDWIHPQYFEILLHHLQTSGVPLAICQFSITHEYSASFISSDSFVHAQIMDYDALLKNHQTKTYVCGHIYTSSLLKKHRFSYELKLAEDSTFNVTLFCSHQDITAIVLDIPLYFYFQRLTSAVHTLPASEYLKVSKLYLEQSRMCPDEKANHHYMVEAMKKCLTARYMPYFLHDRNALSICNSVFRQCLRLYLKNHTVSPKDKTKYILLYLFPGIYRQFRIKDDPSMLEWEKNMISAQKKHSQRRNH